MKCPYCKYKHGYEWEKDEHVDVKGEKGNFYSFPIKIERDERWETDQETVYGCPKCGIIFIDVL